jgi:hypothetical protein
MGNVPSDFQVTRYPTPKPETYDYVFDLSAFTNYQIRRHFLKRIRGEYKTDLNDLKQLTVKNMTSPRFEDLFRNMNPIVKIVRTPSSSFSEPPISSS